MSLPVTDEVGEEGTVSAAASGGLSPHVVMAGTDAPLAAGETVLLIDRKRRRHLITLEAGATWHSHLGPVEHDRLIGAREGTAVRTVRNMEVVVLRPTRDDFVLKMKRGAQVIYGKDQAMIVAQADVRPGATVVEAGAGSGALTLALLDAVGPTGRVVSFDLRADHAAIARRNVERFHGGAPANWSLVEADVSDGLVGLRPHRVILDLVDPWNVVASAGEALAPGGILLAYMPTVPQVMRLTETLWSHGGFAEVRTNETLVRGWDVDGLAVRPAHRMVAHTAFLTSARRVLPGPEGGPVPPRRRGTESPSVAWVDGVVEGEGEGEVEGATSTPAPEPR